MRPESIGEKIIGANWDGDIKFLQQMASEKKFDPLHVTEEESWNYLHRANLISPSPEETIKFYIDNGVPVNAQDYYGMTPLHYALREQNRDAAMLLLKAGANPNTPNEKNITPLAYINGMPEELDLLKLMLEKGGDVNFDTGGGSILEKIKKYRSKDLKFAPVIKLMEKYEKGHRPYLD